jgi:alkylation response protein AidB-like acyl-CoA dehydrogenase
VLDRPSATATLSSGSQGVADLAALAGDGATEAETNRRVAPEVVEAMLAAGFARYFVPARWGGDSATASFVDLVDSVVAVGQVCGSTAWVASLTASLGRMGAFLPIEGQQDLWSDGPDTLVVGALMPLGRAEPVDGGWRLSGRWPFVSAVEYSDWALVCGMAARGEQSEARFFAVPRTEYAIEDTWFNVGMRATGSNTLVLDEVVVPATRSFSRDDLIAGRAVATTDPCHLAPLKAGNGLSFGAPVLGTARGALAAWSAYIGAKRQPKGAAAGNGVSGGSGTVDEMTLARASGEIDAAQLLLERAAGIADRGAAAPLAVAQNSRDCALAVDMAVTAVDRLFRAAGTTGQASSSPLQRFWRDVNVGATHVVLKFELAAVAYASQLLDA